MATSQQSHDVLTTYALGSCIGVALYDAKVGAAGLLHFQLPYSNLDSARAAERPLMFADTGIAALLADMTQIGCNKRRMRVRLAGGGKILNDQNMFDIGRRNHAAIRKVLWQHGMFIDCEMVGGVSPMTMQLHVGTGEVVVKCDGKSSIF